MQNKEAYPLKQFLQDYWLFLEGRRFRFIFFTIFRSLSDLAPFATAYLLGRIIDFFTTYPSGDPLTPFYLMVAGIALLGSLRVWLRFFAKVRMQTIAANIRKEIRVKAMSKLMDLSLKWHEQEETGSKIQKINEGGDKIFQGIKDFSNQGVYLLTNLIASLVIFITLDWRYGLFAVLYITIYLTGEYYFNQKLKYWITRLNKIKEKVSGKIHESASNLLTVKSLGLKDIFQKSTSFYENKYYSTWVKTRDISQLKLKTIKIFSVLGYAGFLFLLGFDVLNNSITVGSILVYAAYFNRLKGALGQVTLNIYDFIKVRSAVGRFMTIFRQKIFERKDLPRIPKHWKQLTLQNLSFKYKDKLILNNFNLTIKPGDRIGLVGSSGCGKSTLVKLLLNLYPPTKGRILLDGKELDHYRPQSLTNTIAVVLQDSEMFNLTLLNNITLSSPKKDFLKFKRAVKIAQLEPIIKKLPQGLNTLIGEKGYKLSGGERQRIGLARALYKDSPFLILDEATSSLDSKTESLIQQNLEKNLTNKTLLIIAHRLSTLKNVDRIIVMDKGKIVETGTFKELIKNKGKFHQLYQLQRNK